MFFVDGIIFCHSRLPDGEEEGDFSICDIKVPNSVNLQKTGTGEVIAIFWTINDPPRHQGLVPAI